MAPNSVFLLGESPRTGEPGRLQSMKLQRVGPGLSDLAHTFLKTSVASGQSLTILNIYFFSSGVESVKFILLIANVSESLLKTSET